MDEIALSWLLSPLSSFSIAAFMTQRLLREQFDLSTRNNKKKDSTVGFCRIVTDSHFDIFLSVEITKKDVMSRICDYH
jgi:hypothetical protein